MNSKIQDSSTKSPPLTQGNTQFPASMAAGRLTAELPSAAEQPFSAFGSLGQFRDAQRMATMLAHSSIVPETFRGEEHIGDCVIALEIANRIGASILAVMQNLHLFEGKPGWSSQFLISCVNASKRFTPIRYEMTGTRGEDSWGCIAWAIDESGERLKSPEVTLKMAKEEGWYYRLGSKWKTMPELMLCYRSATLFTRLYAPEITMGIQTTEEVVEMGPDGNGRPSRPVFETGAREPKCNLKTQPKNAVDDVPPRSAATVPKPTAPQVREAAAAQASVQPPEPATPNSQPGPYNYLKALTGLIGLSGHSEDNVLRFLRNTRRCDESLATLAEVAGKQPDAVVWAHDNWHVVDRELKRLKQEKPS